MGMTRKELAEHKNLKAKVMILESQVRIALEIPSHDAGASTASTAAQWEAVAVALQIEINLMETALNGVTIARGRSKE